MGRNVTQKIIKNHLVEGKMKKGNTIALRIDQTLTQDATGTMAYLQFEAMGVPKVQTELSVSYVDHNTLQTGFENADDHIYLQSVASKHGIYFSRPGNGICHQVHLERFGVPGKTLLGSDSHTPTGGGIGMMAMGAGGLDVALAMAGQPFRIVMPEVVEVRLTGRLQPWVSAKDIILELLRRETVKGGVNKVYEYTGDGVETLTVPERSTITNMGAELGATTSIFPSDKVTKQFLKAQGRVEAWTRLKADSSAAYDKTIEIDLDKLEPMIAKPHMPDNVVKLSELAGTKVQQVAIGSCTNSSYRDLMIVAGALKGKTVHPGVSLGIAPGSKQVMNMLALNGALADMVAAGARILESTCGPCIGMGQSPSTDAVSLRTFNRNFIGRSGTQSAQVHLVSPEVAVAAALTGEITDPRKLGDYPDVKLPKKFLVDDNMVLSPAENGGSVEIIRGPNIAPCPTKEPLGDTLEGEVILKVDDNITTDHIMPAGAKILPLRSNVPKISEHVFVSVDPEFPARAKAKGGGFIVGGSNYGQGSSREHAALAPMYLGVKAVITKSFARIHLANLTNFGILPLTFVNEGDYDSIDQGDVLEMKTKSIKKTMTLRNKTKGESYQLTHALDPMSVDIIKAGGSLAYARANMN